MPSDREDDQTTPTPNAELPVGRPRSTSPDFGRTPIQWGRPPPVTFRTGPLPKAMEWPATPPSAGRQKPAGALTPTQGQSQSRTPAAPRASGILSGSLAPRTAQPPVRELLPPLPEPPQDAVENAASATASSPPLPTSTPEPPTDMTVRPLPPADALIPSPSALAPEPIAIAPLDATMLETVAARPRRNARTKSVPLYVGLGVAALAVIAVAVWLMTRTPGAPEAPVATAAATPDATLPAAPAIATPPVSAPLVAEAPVAAPVRAPSRLAAETPVASPTTTPQAPSRPRASAPQAQTAAPAASPVEAPVIATQPLVVVPIAPPPTAARAAPADPDAPVVTRPQPLD